jgi:hypothetical protein
VMPTAMICLGAGHLEIGAGSGDNQTKAMK